MPPSNDRSAAIIDETGNITSVLSDVAYATAVNDPEPETKEAAVGIFLFSSFSTAGLQMGEFAVPFDS